MHFSFSTMTVSSVFAAPLLATLLDLEVTARIASFAYEQPAKGTVRGRGAECSPVQGSKAVESHADTGILTCGHGLTCVEDGTSSLGGRCAASSHASLVEPPVPDNTCGSNCTTACTFKNGTSGYKCVGSWACPNINISNVGCGSCLGDDACASVDGNDLIVGEDSCIGTMSCRGSKESIVGSHSCQGSSACLELFESQIGDYSCSNGNLACAYQKKYFDVGYKSCNGEEACFNSIHTDFGDCVCNGDKACYGLTKGIDMDYNNCTEPVIPCGNNCTTACTFENGTSGYKCVGLWACPNLNISNVGCGGCIGDYACNYNYGNDLTVGEDSCVGTGSCLFATGSKIGSHSCQGTNACSVMNGNKIGNYSCVGADACTQQKKFEVGYSSCNGIRACYNSFDTDIVGDCLCNGNYVCAYLTSGVDLDYNNCTNATCSRHGSIVKVESTTNQHIQMFEVKVMSNGVDVAHERSANQSSTLKTFYASNAVDGNLTTFSHTIDSNAWWMVDLDQMVDVDSVEITNRWCVDPNDENKCLCRLSNATISILDAEKQVISSKSLGNTCDELSLEVDFTCPADRNNPTECFPTANKVKLNSNTGQPIQVFEVEVMSMGSNIAINKMATQSSDYKGKDKFAASKAVDGNTTTFQHTEEDGCGWWEVDLGQHYAVEEIKITNRWCREETDPNGCLCRLSHASLLLFDNEEWVHSVFVGNTCGELEWVYKYNKTSEYCN